jgi:hypothetical protein
MEPTIDLTLEQTQTPTEPEGEAPDTAELDKPGDAMTIEEVKTLMGSSQSEAEWDANCDRVKKAHNGYPSFWFREIVMSGLAGRVAARFGRDDRVHVQTMTIG